VSTENIPDHGLRETGRIGLDQEMEVGELISSIKGLRFRLVDDFVNVLAWSDQEVAVDSPRIFRVSGSYPFA